MRAPPTAPAASFAAAALAALAALAAAGCSPRAVDETPGAARPLSTYVLDASTTPDRALQEALEAIDRRLGAKHGIPDAARACGVLDLGSSTDSPLRLAMVRPDAMFYGASVPKICILLAYFATHPEAVDDLDTEVRRELELMIKRSDNDLAAKYSRLVGLDAIQALQVSNEYRFYDPEHGGGLWSGKHYGSPQPRRGDPLQDLSHAATVRQCLRFYLLLEQGRLVSPRASEMMAEIFAAPGLDFHHSNFVRGLKGRDVTLIRKSGLWESWHLDTARVEHGDRVYLIAGITEHEKGSAYLADLAAEVDRLLCGDTAPAPARHAFLDEGLATDGAMTPAVELPPIERRDAKKAKDGDGNADENADENADAAIEHVWRYESPTVVSPIDFNEALPSWNIDAPDGTGFVVELRVGRSGQRMWSPWLEVGEWGTVPPRDARERLIEFDHGKIDVDYLSSERRWDRAQLRVDAFARRATSDTAKRAREVSIARLSLATSDRTGLPTATRPKIDVPDAPAANAWKRRLDVPYRSQRVEDAAIASRICSPTSVAMVMAYRGVDKPTAEVAARAYDAAHDIYGNWPRAVQTAYSYGVPGHVRRFASWREVEAEIARGQPLIISIAVKKGQLTGAPYPSTDGHLLVLTGFDARGDVEVNDPAAREGTPGRRVYRRSELETVWLGRGGTAYVLLARE